MARTKVIKPEHLTEIARRYTKEYPGLFTVTPPLSIPDGGNHTEWFAWDKNIEQAAVTFAGELAAAEKAGLVEATFWTRVQNGIRQRQFKMRMWDRHLTLEGPNSLEAEFAYTAEKARLAWRVYASRGTPASFLSSTSRWAANDYPEEYRAQLQRAFDRATQTEIARYHTKLEKLIRQHENQV